MCSAKKERAGVTAILAIALALGSGVFICRLSALSCTKGKTEETASVLFPGAPLSSLVFCISGRG
jgi:hypothetical protein